MAVAFTHLSWWLWSGKQQEPEISNGSSTKSSSDRGLREKVAVEFPLVNVGNVVSSSRRVKRKWRSREERKIDRDYDVVLVPSDGGCVSGSDSDDSDWSIGWLEPHGAGFQSDDESEDSFAVLVPCYGHGHGIGHEDMGKNSRDYFLDTIGNIADIYTNDNKKYVEQWLSSLRNS